MKGIATVDCPTTDAVRDALAQGNALRATRATRANDTSSRSHAICVLTLTDHEGTRRGALRLVDLAGREHRGDLQNHDSVRLEEAKEINQSLGALKECIRIQLLNSRVPPGGKLAHVPIRTSKLTTLLKDCFEGAAMSFIAHVAPLRSTARHTVSTLEYSAAMLQATRAQRERTGFADVERWSPKKLAVR